MVGAARREVAPWRPQSRRTTARIRAGRRPWRASIRGPTTAKDLALRDRADERGVDPRSSVTAKGVDPAARKGVDLRSGDRHGCRSAAWSELEGSRSASPTAAQVFDPRHRADRICSIRAPGDRASVRSARPASVRSAGSSGPEGCRSARPAPAKGVDPWRGSGRKGVDPRVRRLRRVSIHGIEQTGSVRSASQGTTQVFDPRVRQLFDPRDRADRKGVDPRVRRLRRVSIRRIEQTGSVRSARPATGQVFDPRGRGAGCKCSIRTPPGRVSVRSARPATVRSAGLRGPEGCRSARPATPKSLDPRDRAPPEVFDPRSRRLRKCSIRGMEQDGSVRSEPPATAQVFDPRAWGRVQVFDSHSARPRKCSIRASGQVFDPQDRADRKTLAATNPPKSPLTPVPCGVAISPPAGSSSARTTRVMHSGVRDRSLRFPVSGVVESRVGAQAALWGRCVVFQACTPRGATVSPGRAAWRCRATRVR